MQHKSRKLQGQMLISYNALKTQQGVLSDSDPSPISMPWLAPVNNYPSR